MMNPLIKDGMILWKGKDPRKGYCYYRYNALRNEFNKHSICFPEMVDTMEKLGFEVKPHWTNHGNVRGYYAIKGVEYIGPCTNVDMVKIDPVVEKILAGQINNQSFKELLSLDKE